MFTLYITNWCNVSAQRAGRGGGGFSTLEGVKYIRGNPEYIRGLSRVYTYYILGVFMT